MSNDNPSGTQTNEERREAGRVRLCVWLEKDASNRLEALAARTSQTKRDVIHKLIRAKR